MRGNCDARSSRNLLLHYGTCLHKVFKVRVYVESGNPLVEHNLFCPERDPQDLAVLRSIYRFHFLVTLCPSSIRDKPSNLAYKVVRRKYKIGSYFTVVPTRSVSYSQAPNMVLNENLRRVSEASYWFLAAYSWGAILPPEPSLDPICKLPDNGITRNVQYLFPCIEARTDLVNIPEFPYLSTSIRQS